MPRLCLTLSLLAAVSCAGMPPHLGDTSARNSLSIQAPSMVMGDLGRPTPILFRFGITGPDCYGVKVFWGDGESSAWITCDETSRVMTHRYKIAGELQVEAVLVVGDREVKRTTKLLTIAGS
jgi:hypothetical protein